MELEVHILPKLEPILRRVVRLKRSSEFRAVCLVNVTYLQQLQVADFAYKLSSQRCTGVERLRNEHPLYSREDRRVQ